MNGWSARELEIIARLRELRDVAAPDAAAREEIRRRIRRRAMEPGPSARSRTIAAAAALLIALGGLGMVLSQDSLPGDVLYAVKRATESAELGLTLGESARADDHLRFAAIRLDELIALGSPDGRTMADFEREASAGAAGLTTLGVLGSGQELTDLRSWVHRQTAKGPPFAKVTGLLGRIDARARALSGRLDCYRITSGQSDDLGAVPATGVCQAPTDVFARPAPASPPGSGPPGPPPPEDLAAVRSPVPVSRPPATRPVPPSRGGPAPSAIDSPITAPIRARAPGAKPPPPPVLSIPPVLPGLPGAGVV